MSERRWLHWFFRRTREAVRDNNWVLPALGGVIGVLLALAVGTGGGTEDAGWTVTVDQSRDTLLQLLALLFTALSIVLALASVAAQNVVNRFGSRTLRLYLRRSPERYLVAMFCVTAAFVIVEQFQLRKLPSDGPAPVAGLVISVILLILTATLLIAYVASVVRWFRVDRAVVGLRRAVLDAAASAARTRQGRSVQTSMPTRPEDAIDLLARQSGFVAEIDGKAVLDQLGEADALAAITQHLGSAVVEGEPIGWIAAQPGDATALPKISVDDVVDVATTRELVDSIEYGLVGMVDIAILALSPAVNDPNTAVEVIEEMSFLLHALDQEALGPHAAPDDQSTPRVVVSARSFGELVELATTQIVLYGNSDPMVDAALQRMARSLRSLKLSDEDRRAVKRFGKSLQRPACNSQ
ncbi:MAG: DUF2254 family protein [Acidimicrobiales bacterium]